MDWFKKHADTIVILGSFALCVWNINEKMNDNFATMEKEMNSRFSSLEKDMAIVKTAMIMQNMMPAELAAKD